MTTIVLGFVVFLATLIGIIVFSAILHWGRNRQVSFLAYIYYPVIFNTTGQLALSGRNLYTTTSSTDEYALPDVVMTISPIAIWVSRLISLFILFCVAERVVNRLLSYERKHPIPMMLLLAFVFYFVTTVLFSAFLGKYPSLSHEYFYLFLGGFAALFFDKAEGEVAIESARNAMLVSLVVSAICMIVKPELVFTNNYHGGFIPGLTVRYFGLTSHSNVLGPMAAVFMLCLWSKPYTAGWLNYFAWFMGMMTQILAQSKTSWVSFLVCAVCLAYYRNADFIKHYFFNFRRPVFLSVFLVMGMMVVSAVVLTLIFSTTGNPLNSFLASKAGASLMTMTGRDVIWEVALQEWHRSPVFGYGLTIWDEAYRARIGIKEAVTAHSQFYQVLASAGIVGVVGLIVYLLTLLSYVLKTRRASKGLTLAIFLIIMFRGVSEVSLSMIGYYGSDELIHILLLMIIASCVAKDRVDAADFSSHAKLILTR